MHLWACLVQLIATIFSVVTAPIWGNLQIKEKLKMGFCCSVLNGQVAIPAMGGLDMRACLVPRSVCERRMRPACPKEPAQKTLRSGQRRAQTGNAQNAQKILPIAECCSPFPSTPGARAYLAPLFSVGLDSREKKVKRQIKTNET